ncbi:hypothetical protein KI387_002783, partial [Taxus chinensis]
GHSGQKYAEDADRPVWCKSVHFGRVGEICPRQSGTVGTKVRGGREPPGSAETGNFRLGQLGREKPKEPRANQILPRVFTAKMDE